MRITELFTAKSIELDSAASNRDEILSRLVELQATHGNITDTEAYKKALYAREDEASTYVDNGITVPHAKTNVVTRPSLAALRLSPRCSTTPRMTARPTCSLPLQPPKTAACMWICWPA